MTICVNMFAGAGAGKSTMATTLFGLLKHHGVNCEYVSEYAKTLAYSGRLNLKPLNQLKIFANQHERQFILNNKVDVIITDSPLPLSTVYNTEHNNLFNALVLHEFRKYDNINFYIKRIKEFIQNGRKGSKRDATEIDKKTLKMLENEQIPFKIINCSWKGLNSMLSIVIKRLNIEQKYKICRV